MFLPIQERAERALETLDELDAPQLIERAIRVEFPGRIALVSSFGTESALLLSMVAEVDKALPVLFIDTGKLFAETLDYRDELVSFLGLTNVQTITPDARALAERDPTGQLWHFDADACCKLRKVEPLVPAQVPYDALLSGRKRYHGAMRKFLKRVEVVDGRIKIDPLANWDQARVAAEYAARELPAHPLKAKGYPSVGCAPCTIPVGEGADIRAGRWAGTVKSECGIHLSNAALQSLASSDL